MTVPGKGGRPRKWRSDADRVRAYRARQRGEQEPPTVDAVPTGDEGAVVAWERVRELGETVEAQRQELRAIRDQLRRTQKELDQEHGASLVLEEANARLRARVDTLTEESEELRTTIANLRSLLAEQRRAAPPAPGPNRAQRRQAARDRRRRR